MPLHNHNSELDTDHKAVSNPHIQPTMNQYNTVPLRAHNYALAAFLWHPRVSRLSIFTDPSSDMNKLRWEDYDDMHPCKLLHCMSQHIHDANTATYTDRTYDLVNEWTLVHDHTTVASMIGVYDCWSNGVLVLDLVIKCNTTENVVIGFCYNANQIDGNIERFSRMKHYARYALRVLAAQYGMSATGYILVVRPDDANFDSVD